MNAHIHLPTKQEYQYWYKPSGNEQLFKKQGPCSYNYSPYRHYQAVNMKGKVRRVPYAQMVSHQGDGEGTCLHDWDKIPLQLNVYEAPVDQWINSIRQHSKETKEFVLHPDREFLLESSPRGSSISYCIHQLMNNTCHYEYSIDRYLFLPFVCHNMPEQPNDWNTELSHPLRKIVLEESLLQS